MILYNLGFTKAFSDFLRICMICILWHVTIVNKEHTYILEPCKGHTLLAGSVVCNRRWHLPGNPKLVWHPARLIKEGGCVDLSMDTLHLKYPLVLDGSEGSALTLPLFRLSPRIIMLCHYSSTMTLYHFFWNILWHQMAFLCQCAFKLSFTLSYRLEIDYHNVFHQKRQTVLLCSYCNTHQFYPYLQGLGSCLVPPCNTLNPWGVAVI